MRVGIVGNVEKPELPEAVGLLIGCLRKHHVEYVLEEGIGRLLFKGGLAGSAGQIRPSADCAQGVDMLVAFGGDGTILSAARNVGARRTPILGINLGKLGFLAEVAPSEILEAVEDIITNRYILEERLVLQGSSATFSQSPFYAANDVVVGKARSTRLIDIETHINGAFAVTYRGDGLIISTPTGSTAYGLSNGGPIITPTCKVLCLTPISPHTLSGRPVVVPDDAVIRIVTHTGEDEVLVSADGREEIFAKTPLEIEVRRAPHCLRLVRRLNRSYFDVLRAKLLWGKDPRSHS